MPDNRSIGEIFKLKIGSRTCKNVQIKALKWRLANFASGALEYQGLQGGAVTKKRPLSRALKHLHRRWLCRFPWWRHKKTPTFQGIETRISNSLKPSLWRHKKTPTFQGIETYHATQGRCLNERTLAKAMQ